MWPFLRWWVLRDAANVPSGINRAVAVSNSTRLNLNATIGGDLTTSDPGNSAFFTGPYTHNRERMEIPPFIPAMVLFKTGVWDYLTVPDGIAPNGGGSYVNNYTVMIDYVQTTETLQEPITVCSRLPEVLDSNDGDLWITGGAAGSTQSAAAILAIRASTFDASQWHRIVWSVDNNNFFRVYVDGTLFLDSAGAGSRRQIFSQPGLLIFSQTIVGKTAGDWLAQ